MYLITGLMSMLAAKAKLELIMVQINSSEGHWLLYATSEVADLCLFQWRAEINKI